MAYAHLPGRCPECRAPMDAPHPGLRPPVPPVGEEDLLPIEEEWPEAGEIVTQDPTLAYTFRDPLPDLELNRSAPRAPLVETEETYSFAPGQEPEAPGEPVRPPQPRRKRSRSPAPAEPESQAYGVLPVAANLTAPIAPDEDLLAEPQEKSRRQALHEPLPPPPTRPFIEGVWTFAFRPASFLALFWLSVGFTLVGLLATIMVLCADTGGAALLGIAIGAPLSVGFFIWSGTYAANGFLAVVEETAAGADRITWPGGAQLAEGFGKLAYLVWVGAVAGVVVALPWLLLLNAAEGSLVWMGLAFLPWALLFPVFLFSSMAASSRMLVLEPRTLAAFFKNPRVFGILLVSTVLLFGPALVLTYLALSRMNFPAALVAGVLWAVGFMTYARLLGRAGYVLMRGDKRRR